ncbi:hypothetical protein HCEG_07658 [Histoplasma capsulatum var. duboisii H88]|uniref:Uncharacterized protein n=1 Tax=Ajellomyces capsulatus (strain H88) TaxID=544711 RepID=F0URB6_AJEC8|nr:hypothetical protein HCEG_07658 [Histoplasma capsulatum var. duboisii H88]
MREEELAGATKALTTEAPGEGGTVHRGVYTYLGIFIRDLCSPSASHRQLASETQTRSKLKRAPGGGFDGSITETVWEGWEGRTGQGLSLGGLKESGFKSPTFWVPD